MAKLFLMMGIPGSGKSTFLKNHTELYKDKIVSRDEIRFSKIRPNEEYFAREKEVFKEYCRQVNDALKMGYNVYADATHLNRASRSKLLRRIYIPLEEINVIWMKVPLEVALERNKKREGRAYVPPEQIKSMYTSLQMPSFETEDIDKVYIVKENSPIEIVERSR